MRKDRYLFDTHALHYWYSQQLVSREFIDFFDKQAQQGNLFVSSISFWEIALLAKKGKFELDDVHGWKNVILSSTNIQMIDPTATEMIDSTLLPDYHKDPFDRLLVAQANRRGFILVTKDYHIRQYDVQHYWM